MLYLYLIKSKWACIPALITTSFYYKFNLSDLAISVRYWKSYGAWFNSWLIKDDTITKDVGYDPYALEIQFLWFKLRIDLNLEYEMSDRQ